MEKEYKFSPRLSINVHTQYKLSDDLDNVTDTDAVDSGVEIGDVGVGTGLGIGGVLGAKGGLGIGSGIGAKAGLGIGSGIGAKAGLAVDGAAAARNVINFARGDYRGIADLLKVKRTADGGIGASIGGGVIRGEISGGGERSRTVKKKVIVEPGEGDSEKTVQEKKTVKTRKIEETPSEDESPTETRKRTITRTITDDDGHSEK
ncbi:unnamed protein product [Schistosoma turkestanicum]|nr:unnamed protein product [Schistosoma turkestanicum]